MDIVLLVILVIVGYLAISQVVLAKTDNPNQRFAVMIAVLLIYGCVVGGVALIAVMIGDLGTALLMLIFVISIVEIVALIITLRSVRDELEAKYIIIFLVYLAFLLGVTILGREHRAEIIIETDVLAPFREAKAGSMAALYHMILNTALFVPLGFLFTQIHPWNLGKAALVFGMGALVSTVIETCQFLFLLGNCDLGDIFANTIGALVGLVIYNFIFPYEKQ